MESLKSGYRALVVGASGGIGAAIAEALRADLRCGEIVEASRRDGVDVTREDTIAAAARRWAAARETFDLIFDATGALTIDGAGPEKSLRAIDPATMAAQFALNTIGPALLLKHLSPLLPRDERCFFATLSARVGSIGDNRLGGWISYRAAKAALNQVVRTAAIEIQRTHPHAVVVALHPGTVATRLSDPFASARNRVLPEMAAGNLLRVLDDLPSASSGGFFAYDGSAIPW